MRLISDLTSPQTRASWSLRTSRRALRPFGLLFLAKPFRLLSPGLLGSALLAHGQTASAQLRHCATLAPGLALFGGPGGANPVADLRGHMDVAVGKPQKQFRLLAFRYGLDRSSGRISAGTVAAAGRKLACRSDEILINAEELGE